MISGDLKLIGQSLEIVAPFVQRFDDREHLLIVDLVITLGRVHSVRSESNGMPFAVVLLLHQYATSGVARGVNLNARLSVRVVQC